MGSWGDSNYSEWGSPEWGSEQNPNALPWFADLLAQTPDLDQAWDADLLAVLTADGEWDADLLALGTLDRRFEADFFVSRLPTDALAKRYTKPVLLVDLDLPSGRLRIADRDLTAAGFGWSGYLQNAGEIQRAVGASADDMRLRFADPGGSIAAGFGLADPPEGATVQVFLLALDDEDANLFEVFNGTVEEVISVSPALVELEIVRSDAVKDRQLGRLLTTAIEPDAPDESVGKMIPHVYGDVRDHEGLVTSFNAVSQTATAIFATTPTVVLADASRFADSGEADMDEERITWTGKFRNELLGVTRGASGTEASPHPPGTRVVERGPFEVLFADHPVTRIRDVVFLDGDGNQAIPKPEPTIDVAEAKAKWTRTPRIVVPSRSVDLNVFGFDAVGPANTATNPLNAARESVGFTDLNFALVPPATVLQLERSADVEPEGDIVRVGLAVAFDPDNVGARVRVAGQTLGFLQNLDNVPAWALRRLERHFRSTYDVRDPQHNHSQSISTQTIRPELMISQGANPWINRSNAMDGNPASGAVYNDTTGNREWLVMRGGNVSLGPGESIVSAQLKVWQGGQSGPMNLRVVRSVNNMITVLRLDIPSQSQATFSQGIVETNPIYLLDAAQWRNADWVIQPTGQQGTRYEIRDIWAELGISRGINNAPTNVAQRRSVVNFFDVTNLAQADWDFFTDTGSGGAGRIRIDNSPANTRITTVLWVVEVRPKNRTVIEVPRVFARVRGLEPAGRPTEVSRLILTQSKPLGLGLPSETITQGSYATARESLLTDGVEVNFALRKQTSGLEVLRKIAEQADLRQTWNAGRHELRRKPNPAALPAVFKTYRDDDVLQGTLARARQPIEVVVNRWETSYRPSDRIGDFTRALEDEDAASQAQFGERSRALILDYVTTSTTATLVTARKLARSKDPHWLVQFDLPLVGLELRQGDLVSLDHKQFSFAKAEVLGLSVVDQGSLSIRVSAVVWEE